jgi:16S rRNA processing protein RimM
LKFEDYGSAEKVSEFKGCRVFLTTELRNQKQNTVIQNYEGYKIFVSGNILLGSVKEIITNPGQSLLNVTSLENKEILIPFHEDFIVSIDDDKRIILMDLPDGLIELN